MEEAVVLLTIPIWALYLSMAVIGMGLGFLRAAFKQATISSSDTVIPSEKPISTNPPNNNEDIAVTKFREYLRVKTVHPNPNYEPVKEFLLNLAEELKISTKVVYVNKTLPFIIMTIPGSQPAEKSLLLYSHTDVVLAVKGKWEHDPFEAFKDENGNIYGRGAQDMKSVGIQYFEAIRRLFQRGKRQFKRSIHIVWGADEEVGGMTGMGKFIDTREFQELNIGFGLDEGIATPDDTYQIFNGERNLWWLKIICNGSPGHGSRFIENTAAQMMRVIINKALAFRQSEKNRMEANNLYLGDVVSLNWTIIEGGASQQYNVIPEKMIAGFDIRIPPTADFTEMENRIANWCKEAGPDVTYEFFAKNSMRETTPTDSSNPYWVAFEEVLKQEGCKYKIQTFTAGTDARFLRQRGYWALGFSPMINTPQLLHDHNEFLNEKVFLRGVEIYERLIEKLASV